MQCCIDRSYPLVSVSSISEHCRELGCVVLPDAFTSGGTHRVHCPHPVLSLTAGSLLYQLGSTAVGIATKDGVVLAVEKRVTSTLLEPNSIEKVMEIDSHIGCAMSGLISDFKTMIDFGRVEAQVSTRYVPLRGAFRPLTMDRLFPFCRTTILATTSRCRWSRARRRFVTWHSDLGKATRSR